jgi:ribosomal protein L17
MITLGKGGTLHDRRLASARLHQDETPSKSSSTKSPRRRKNAAAATPASSALGQRQGDAAHTICSLPFEQGDD